MAEGPEQRRRQEEIARERLSAERGEIGPEPAASQGEVESLRLELARTRAELSGSVYELQGRLNPQYLGQQAKETSSGLARRNTLPLALMGAGLGWLVYNSRGGSDTGGRRGYQQPALESPREPYGYPYGSPTSYEGREQDGGGATDQARQGARQAQEEAQQRAQQAKGGFQNLLQDNPLAVGAIAVGVGAAFGLSIPETQKEHQAMGQTRDQLANRAQDRADDATRRAESVAERARNTAGEEASRQNLSE